jgi:hypothetical protein
MGSVQNRISSELPARTVPLGGEFLLFAEPDMRKNSRRQAITPNRPASRTPAARYQMGVDFPHTRSKQLYTSMGWPKKVLALDISASHFFNWSGVRKLTMCSLI